MSVTTDTISRCFDEELAAADFPAEARAFLVALRGQLIAAAEATVTEAAGQQGYPANVVQALARVMSELPGIGKEGQAAQQQGGYKYRGIEQITAEVQPLFGRYCVVPAPKVTHSERIDIEVGGKPWTDTILHVRYRFYGPGGPADHIDVGPIVAYGRDNSDKGANKAMSQAYKYALLQSLCISDRADDADGTTVEADRVHGSQRAEAGGSGPGFDEDPADPEQVLDMRAAIRALPEASQTFVAGWMSNNGLPAVSRMTARQLRYLRSVVVGAVNDARKDDAEGYDARKAEARAAFEGKGAEAEPKAAPQRPQEPSEPAQAPIPPAEPQSAQEATNPGQSGDSDGELPPLPKKEAADLLAKVTGMKAADVDERLKNLNEPTKDLLLGERKQVLYARLYRAHQEGAARGVPAGQ